MIQIFLAFEQKSADVLSEIWQLKKKSRLDLSGKGRKELKCLSDSVKESLKFVAKVIKA